MKDSVIAELAIKAQQGDMQAFEKLYTEFSPLVYSILLEITHDTYEAEDLTQDCFVSALKNIQSLKEPAKAKKWLTAIAANHGKDYLKKKKPALLAPEHEFIFEIQEEENPSVLPEENAVLDERSEEIREIVNSVSEDKRLCLVLFYQHEMSITEIAEELGISESAVKSRLFRAREDIREEVEKRNKKGMPLFGIAPLPLILFALRKSSEVASASFAGSAAQATMLTAVTATAGTTAATATTAASVSGAAASGATVAGSTTAAAATAFSAKTVALIVTGAVVVGGGGATVAKVVHDKWAENTTTFIEETTELANENVAVIATREHGEITVEFEGSSVTASFTDNTNASSASVTAQSSSQSNTTGAGTTAQATTKPSTTKTVTTKAPTTAKPTTTRQATTTAKATTTKPSTTAKPTTTSPPTTQGKATVDVMVYSPGSGSEYETYTLTFDAGLTLNDFDIQTGLKNQHGIIAMSDTFNVTTEPGGQYTAVAYKT